MMVWARIILVGGLVLTAVIWAVVEIREDDAKSVKTAIEKQNNEAAGRAHSERTDYDSCLARGGLWNFGAAKCDEPQSGRGD
ncbi:hypothetical protein ILFOPFJJ_05815 [Ensifer psoraleae]|uniref:hypothetical protein n=1 Tax=Sinorhizobium psoraleae TaxID=520838 RepID=UPI00156A5AF1|nr:hypothetical protein [Sinorhizobium psoraleae]NRP74892.1 hypothetical protein [Sinorhizobium psoraleae]